MATRKPCRSNLYCCTTVANDYQITEECELFVIIGPLTRSAVLISRRWILPNSAKVWVVQSLWAAPRQRVKEVNWILRCPQYSASLLREPRQAAVAEAQQLNWGISCVLLWSKLYSRMWVDKPINEFLKTSASLSCPKAFHLSTLLSQRGLKSVIIQMQKHQSISLMLRYRPKLFFFPSLVFSMNHSKQTNTLCSY